MVCWSVISRLIGIAQRMLGNFTRMDKDQQVVGLSSRSLKLTEMWRCGAGWIANVPGNEIAHQLAKKPGVSRIFAGPNYSFVSCLTHGQTKNVSPQQKQILQ